MNDKHLVWSYLCYCVFWLSLTIGGPVYLIVWKGQSEVWFIVGFALAVMGDRPDTWRKLLHKDPDA